MVPDIFPPDGYNPEEDIHIPARLEVVGIIFTKPDGRQRVAVGLTEINTDGSEGRSKLYSFSPSDAQKLSAQIDRQYKKSPGIFGGN